jgi:hypothetical protein
MVGPDVRAEASAAAGAVRLLATAAGLPDRSADETLGEGLGDLSRSIAAVLPLEKQPPAANLHMLLPVQLGSRASSPPRAFLQATQGRCGMDFLHVPDRQVRRELIERIEVDPHCLRVTIPGERRARTSCFALAAVFAAGLILGWLLSR